MKYKNLFFDLDDTIWAFSQNARNTFEEVYQKYLKEVYCFLLRLSGDREIAEELTQQTFAIAFEKLENFRGECKL